MMLKWKAGKVGNFRGYFLCNSRGEIITGEFAFLGFGSKYAVEQYCGLLGVSYSIE